MGSGPRTLVDVSPGDLLHPAQRTSSRPRRTWPARTLHLRRAQPIPETSVQRACPQPMPSRIQLHHCANSSLVAPAQRPLGRYARRA